MSKAAPRRYVAAEFAWTPTVTVFAIYDSQTRSWPVFMGGVRVPQRFDSLDEAQAWADTHLNGGK